MLRKTGFGLACVLVAAWAGSAEEKQEAEPGKGKAVTVEQLAPSIGTWWYAMSGAEGPCGYARLEVRKQDGGAVAIDWELRLAFPGSEYEEERTMVLDAKRRLLSASFSKGGVAVHSGKRLPSGWWEWTVHPKTGVGDSEVSTMTLPDDAVTGLGFVLAAWMPREKGVAFLRADVNETAGFRREGTVVTRGHGPDTVAGEDGDTAAFRFDMTRRDGRSMPIWVNDEGEIVRVDWSGGTVMSLRRKSTKHLFVKVPPAVREMPGGPEKLVVRGEFPGTDPATMFSRWTKADELVRWWPQKAEVEPKVGGKFHLSWPSANWFLEGRITVIEEGKRLGFTWRWRHEPEEAPERKVLVEIAARDGGGSVLTITHGSYTDSLKDLEERKGHLSGWESVCTRLKGLEK